MKSCSKESCESPKLRWVPQRTPIYAKVFAEQKLLRRSHHRKIYSKNEFTCSDFTETIPWRDSIRLNSVTTYLCRAAKLSG